MELLRKLLLSERLLIVAAGFSVVIGCGLPGMTPTDMSNVEDESIAADESADASAKVAYTSPGGTSGLAMGADDGGAAKLASFDPGAFVRSTSADSGTVAPAQFDDGGGEPPPSPPADKNPHHNQPPPHWGLQIVDCGLWIGCRWNPQSAIRNPKRQRPCSCPRSSAKHFDHRPRRQPAARQGFIQPLEPRRNNPRPDPTTPRPFLMSIQEFSQPIECHIMTLYVPPRAHPPSARTFLAVHRHGLCVFEPFSGPTTPSRT